MNARNPREVQLAVTFRDRCVVPILLGMFLTSIAIGAESDRASTATKGVALKLHYGKEVALDDESVRILTAKAEELLASSNFNSRAPRWVWKTSDLLEGYRTTVSGNYLLVTYREPPQIKTVGGEVSTREIVIGFNGPEYASSLFTIDEELRIVGHAKYSGPLCVELLELVKKISKID